MGLQGNSSVCSPNLNHMLWLLYSHEKLNNAVAYVQADIVQQDWKTKLFLICSV